MSHYALYYTDQGKVLCPIDFTKTRFQDLAIVTTSPAPVSTVKNYRVKCLDDGGCPHAITVGQDYDAEDCLLNSSNYNILNCNDGHNHIFNKTRFQVLSVGGSLTATAVAPQAQKAQKAQSAQSLIKHVRCIDNGSGYGDFLTIGKVYEVRDSNVNMTTYQVLLTDNGLTNYDAWKTRFEDVSQMTPVAGKSSVSTAKTDSASPPKGDKQKELDFFKRKAYESECPCGSNWGVCPDHQL